MHKQCATDLHSCLLWTNIPLAGSVRSRLTGIALVKAEPMPSVGEIWPCAESVEVPLLLPLFEEAVRAGFPSPAADYESVRLDIADYLIRHPSATFYARACGDSMLPGIRPGDLLVVDRAVEPFDGSVVIAVLNGEMTLKRLRLRDERAVLVPDNPDYPPIAVSPEADFSIWGVVTFTIHKH